MKHPNEDVLVCAICENVPGECVGHYNLPEHISNARPPRAFSVAPQLRKIPSTTYRQKTRVRAEVLRRLGD